MPGPAPKPADKRARRNKDAVSLKTVQAVPAPQPDLPDLPWPPQTIAWWEALGELPQAREFNAVHWDHLSMVALIHADIWGNGNTKAIPEYQKAMAEYPILPASMLRMRVTALTGDELAAKKNRPAERRAATAKKAYGQLQAVKDTA